MPLEMATYPIAPTHRIQIDVQTASTSSVTVIPRSAAEGHCLACRRSMSDREGPRGVSRSEASECRAASPRDGAAGAASRASPVGADRIAPRGTAGRGDEAVRAASGEDLTMARRVVDLLAPQEGRRGTGRPTACRFPGQSCRLESGAAQCQLDVLRYRLADSRLHFLDVPTTAADTGVGHAPLAVLRHDVPVDVSISVGRASDPCHCLPLALRSTTIRGGRWA